MLCREWGQVNESTGAGIGGLCNHHVTTHGAVAACISTRYSNGRLHNFPLWNALASFLPDQTEQCAFNSKDK